MITWIIRIVVAVAVALGLMALIGMTLPVAHQASGSAEIPAPPATVFALIRDVESYPQWRSGVTTVTVLDTDTELPRFRETGEFGPIIFRMEQANAPAFLRTRIDDPDQPFGGTWTYVLIPGASGTLLTITEDGEVYNPLFRFLSRYVFSQTSTIETYLEDVRRRLSSPQ